MLDHPPSLVNATVPELPKCVLKPECDSSDKITVKDKGITKSSSFTISEEQCERPADVLGSQEEGEGGQDLPRPYKCSFCNKAFHRVEHYNRHIRVHTGEKPYLCKFPGCEKQYSRGDELLRHSRAHKDPNTRTSRRLQAKLQRLASVGVILPPPASVSPPIRHSRAHKNPNTKKSRGLQAAARKHRLAMAPTTPLPASAVGLPNISHPYSYALYSAVVPSDKHYQYYSLPLPAYARSGSHSRDEDDHSHQHAKRQRHVSPNYNSLSSSNFSHNSPSPTPDHAPLAGPVHSPCLQPYSGYPLPPIHNLSPEPRHGDGFYGSLMNYWASLYFHVRVGLL